ncbi:MAG: nucleotidyl transferase AbiEii/AbiGii toxin family protein [Myxococcales bacterium]|nr:nucleotidyl transferase AbiEii/AbiGii toxin family protein [Myxococcales bacterium]
MEYFHLAFLAELGGKLDRALYAVKGGCNLRFFFHSIRYSEGLDLDVQTTGVEMLRRKVDRLLSGASLSRTLGARRIELTSTSRPKQTETTQRWKLGLRIEGVEGHTKIEFSRRGLEPGVDFGVIDPVLTSEYGLPRTLTSHYGRDAALVQKLRALIGRSETQARDVFDLELLIASGAEPGLLGLDEDARHTAQERALSVDFDMFQGQVLAFLPAAQQAQYDSAEIWEELVLRVVDALAEGNRS